MKIFFSLDIDWAHDAIIEDSLRIFEDHGVRCTLFATHKTSVLDALPSNRFEVGIHPNFNPLFSGSGGTAEQILKDLLHLYPNAKGARSHSIAQSSGILNLFAEQGLTYESNQFVPYSRCLQAYKLWNGLIRIPYNWEDDVHFAYRKSFGEPEIELTDSSMKVLDFHPVHIFLNTDTQERYNDAKRFYHEPQKLLALRNKDRPGVRDCLLHLLRQMKEDSLQSFLMSELAQSVICSTGQIMSNKDSFPNTSEFLKKK